MTTWLLPSMLFLFFCVSHSWLADATVKKRLFAKWPSLSAYYRLIYSLISLVILGAWLWSIPSNDSLLYKIPAPFHLFFYGIQFLAILGFIKSLNSFHTGTFLGTQQLKNYVRNQELPAYLDEPHRGQLITSGLQQYVRHPLYSFSILFLIANPVMNLTTAYLSGSLILYFWIGSVFEERKLILRFGNDYIRYQSRTGRFFPNLRT